MPSEGPAALAAHTRVQRSAPLQLLTPDWPAPASVGAAMSLRDGGVSAAPWASLNLGLAVGDDPAAVAENRRRFAAALGARPVWLRQVHGVEVLRLTARTADAPEAPADAAWTTETALACTVQVADCLPVLLAADDGSAVAAVHAGWRGLAAGVIESTLAALQQDTGVAPQQLLAWLGPCIGPQRFEVGEDVLQALGSSAQTADPARFVMHHRADGSRRWLAHLPLLARDRLTACGVRRITDAAACTVQQDSHFFSYRRSGVTGRMAAAVWRR